MDFPVPCRNSRCGFRVPANRCVARCRLLCRDLACAHRRVGCVACFPTLSLILESGAGRQPRLRSPVTCCISSDLESGERLLSMLQATTSIQAMLELVGPGPNGSGWSGPRAVGCVVRGERGLDRYLRRHSRQVEVADEKQLARTIARYGRVGLHRRTRLHGTRQTRRRAAFRGVARTGGKNAVAIASNELFSGWTTMFTDPRLCAAIVDQLTFGDNIIEIGTDSYRLAHTRAQQSALHTRGGSGSSSLLDLKETDIFTETAPSLETMWHPAVPASSISLGWFHRVFLAGSNDRSRD